MKSPILSHCLRRAEKRGGSLGVRPMTSYNLSDAGGGGEKGRKKRAEHRDPHAGGGEDIFRFSMTLEELSASVIWRGGERRARPSSLSSERGKRKSRLAAFPVSPEGKRGKHRGRFHRRLPEKKKKKGRGPVILAFEQRWRGGKGGGHLLDLQISKNLRVKSLTTSRGRKERGQACLSSPGRKKHKERMLRA